MLPNGAKRRNYDRTKKRQCPIYLAAGPKKKAQEPVRALGCFTEEEVLGDALAVQVGAVMLVDVGNMVVEPILDEDAGITGDVQFAGMEFILYVQAGVYKVGMEFLVRNGIGIAVLVEQVFLGFEVAGHVGNQAIQLRAHVGAIAGGNGIVQGIGQIEYNFMLIVRRGNVGGELCCSPIQPRLSISPTEPKETALEASPWGGHESRVLMDTIRNPLVNSTG